MVAPAFPGIGRATIEMVRALAEAGPPARFSLLYGPGEPPQELSGVAAHAGFEVVRVAAAPRSPADQVETPRVLRRLRPQVFHAPYYAIPLYVPGRVVVTIHDLITRIFPLYWPNPLTRAVINRWTQYAAYRADAVLAVSRSTAADVARLLPGAARKVRVAPNGVRARHSGADAATAGSVPYLLYVGSNKPHKNLDRLVGAFGRVAGEVRGNLVIAGAWDPRYDGVAIRTRRDGLDGRVIFERGPSDERLDRLYAGATAFVFPSLYEGFGLPVLEAMAAGLPVATTNRGALREVAGDAALLLDPLDEASIAAALRRLLSDSTLRAELAGLGRLQAARYPWSRTAEATWAVYEEVAARR